MRSDAGVAARAAPRTRRTAQDQAASSSPWIIQAWKDRGLLSSAAEVTTLQELESLHRSSWFVRRNRRSPHASAGTPTTDAGWVARRHRSQAQAVHGGLSTSPLAEAIKAKLPQGVCPVRAVPARDGAKVSPCTSAEDLRMQRQQQQQQQQQQRQRQQQQLRREGCDRGGLVDDEVAARCGPSQLSFPDVYLTLYDLSSCCNALCGHRLGIGAYHSGILLEGLEYTFDNIAATEGSGVDRKSVV